MKVFLSTVLMIALLSAPVMAQEKRKPTLAELKKDLIILNLRIENMELRYGKIKELQERVKAKISQLESAAMKPTPKVEETK